MKWRIKHPELKERALYKFAWLPVKMSHGTIVWLERYIVIQQYRMFYHGCGFHRSHWEDTNTYCYE